MTREEVLKEFRLPVHNRPMGYDDLADEIVRLREELTGAQNTAAVSLEAMHQLRERLAAVEAERDALQQQVVQWWGKDVGSRAERILAALREPSEVVMEASAQWHPRDGLRAAVAAAEKEVTA